MIIDYYSLSLSKLISTLFKNPAGLTHKEILFFHHSSLPNFSFGAIIIPICETRAVAEKKNQQ
jgi:hypothetical protein